jgi:hypothetical protein
MSAKHEKISDSAGPRGTKRVQAFNSDTSEDSSVNFVSSDSVFVASVAWTACTASEAEHSFATSASSVEICERRKSGFEKSKPNSPQRAERPPMLCFVTLTAVPFNAERKVRKRSGGTADRTSYGEGGGSCAKTLQDWRSTTLGRRKGSPPRTNSVAAISDRTL